MAVRGSHVESRTHRRTSRDVAGGDFPGLKKRTGAGGCWHIPSTRSPPHPRDGNREGRKGCSKALSSALLGKQPLRNAGLPRWRNDERARRDAFTRKPPFEARLGRNRFTPAFVRRRGLIASVPALLFRRMPRHPLPERDESRVVGKNPGGSGVQWAARQKRRRCGIFGSKPPRLRSLTTRKDCDPKKAQSGEVPN